MTKKKKAIQADVVEGKNHPGKVKKEDGVLYVVEYKPKKSKLPWIPLCFLKQEALGGTTFIQCSSAFKEIPEKAIKKLREDEPDSLFRIKKYARVEVAKIT